MTPLVENGVVGDIPPTGLAFSIPSRNALVAHAGGHRIIEASAATGATVTLDGTLSENPGSGAVTYTWMGSFGSLAGAVVQVLLPIGVNQIALLLNDGNGGAVVDTATITIVDTTPPQVIPPASVSILSTGTSGARVGDSPALSAFLAGGSAADAVDTAPSRLSAQLGGLPIDENTVFQTGTTTVTFRFRDLAGNIGTATSNVTVIAGEQRRRIAGSGYNFPETTTYRASFSIDASGPSSPMGSLQYSYTRTRMNFVSSSINSFSVTGTTVTVAGTGTVNGVGGHSFTATATDGSPDAFSIVIRRPDGTVHFSGPSKALAGGAFTISSP